LGLEELCKVPFDEAEDNRLVVRWFGRVVDDPPGAFIEGDTGDSILLGDDPFSTVEEEVFVDLEDWNHALIRLWLAVVM